MTGRLVYLIVYLIDPFITESHHSYRNFYRSKIGYECCQSGSRTDLKRVRTLIVSRQVITRTIGMFPLPVSISQTHFIEEAEHFTAAQPHIGTQKSGCGVVMLQIHIVFDVERKIIAQINVYVSYIEVGTGVGEPASRCHIISKKVSSERAQTECITFGIDVCQYQKLILISTLLRIRNCRTHKPLPFRDKHTLHDSTVKLLLCLDQYRTKKK